MPVTLYEIVWIFIIYAFFGWCTEVAYAALDLGKFVNRGFLNGPYCPIYGVGVLIVVGILTPLKENLFILYIGSFLLTSILEFITGYIMEKVFKNKWWDYSDQNFNIMGYVCLKFSLIWGFACTFIMLIIHPIIYGFIGIIPHTLGVAALIIIMAVFFIDCGITVSTIMKFNNRMKVMNEIGFRLKEVSNQIGENICENVLEVLEKKEEFVDNHTELLNNLADKKEDITDSAQIVMQRLKEEQEELMTKYKALYEKKSIGTNRLMKAFPGMKSKDNDEILQKLKHFHLEKKNNK